MRRALDVAFLLMGFTFTIAQTVLARELLVAFSGNELSIGLILGCWLLLEAVGSAWAGRLAPRLSPEPILYALLQVLLALILPLTVWLAFGVRNLVGVQPGEGIGLAPTALTSLLLLLPVGLVDGAMFSVGCHVLLGRGPRPAPRGEGSVPTISRVYALEAVGGIVGGFAFTWLLVQREPALTIALILSACNLWSAVSLLWRPRERVGRAARVLLAACAALLAATLAALSPGPNRWLNGQAHRWQWPGQDLTFYRDSPYGNVAVVRSGEQFTFFSNGVPVLTAPVPDVMYVEELVHLPLLWVERPRRALVLGGGLGGVVAELAKYGWERVDYAELDPALIAAVQANPTPLTEAELAYPALHLEVTDGRHLVRTRAAGSPLRADERYDLILMSVPYPSTLLLNRFYSREMFLLADALLADEGVLAFALPGSLNYLSPGQQALHRGVQATLEAVFPHVRAIPGENILWLASRGAPLEATPREDLIRRWEGRGIAARLLTAKHLEYKFLPAHEEWLARTLAAAPPAPPNTDLRPTGVLAGLAYWNEQFAPGLAPFFLGLARLPYGVLDAAALAVGLMLVLVAWRGALRRERVAVAALALTGFGGMAADLLVIFAFQALRGYLYSHIGALVASFMGGLALGSVAMARWLGKGRVGAGRAFLLVEVALVGFWALLPGAFWVLARPFQPQWVATLVPAFLYGVNALAGFLVGLQFPAASGLLGASSRVAGALYAADLVGAFLGALLTAAVLVPAAGVLGTCGLVALLKAGSLGAVLLARRAG
jgi:spermidine synthase